MGGGCCSQLLLLLVPRHAPGHGAAPRTTGVNRRLYPPFDVSKGAWLHDGRPTLFCFREARSETQQTRARAANVVVCRFLVCRRGLAPCACASVQASLSACDYVLLAFAGDARARGVLASLGWGPMVLWDWGLLVVFCGDDFSFCVRACLDVRVCFGIVEVLKTISL